MPISDSLKAEVAKRAEYRCEYCRISEDHTVKKHEPDHIIPIKHGGTDDESNLAWACFLCNRHRGTDVAAYDSETGQLTPLFNPRFDKWSEHFEFEAGTLIAISDVARVTIMALRINRPERIEVRKALYHAGLYP